MKKSLMIGVALWLGVSATAFAGSHDLEDVPKGNWAYGAVMQLAHDGIIEGFDDNVFKGDSTITRYEMAQIVAKALLKKSKANPKDAALLKTLQTEYKEELAGHNERLKKLEYDTQRVKIYGDVSLRYVNDKYNGQTTPNGNQTLYMNMYGDYKIDQTWTAHTQSELKYYWGNTLGVKGSTDMGDMQHRLWFDGKIGDVNLTAGRKWDARGMGLIWATDPNGIWVSMGKSHTTFFVGQGESNKGWDSATGANGSEHCDAYYIHTWRTIAPWSFANLLLGGNQRQANLDPLFPKYTLATKWGEVSADMRLNDDWRMQIGYGRSNADEFNDAYGIGFKYKETNLAQPGTYSIAVKGFHYGRNASFYADGAWRGSYGGDYGTTGFNGYDDMWGALDIGDQQKYTSYMKGWLISFDYVLAKAVDTEVLYTDQELEQPKQGRTVNRKLFRTFVNFRY